MSMSEGGEGLGASWGAFHNLAVGDEDEVDRWEMGFKRYYCSSLT